MFWNRDIEPDGKAVLITGCDSGFGHRLAIRLNEMGFRVYATVLDSSNSGSEQLALNCQFKHKMIVLEMDVTDDQQISDCYTRVNEDLDKSNHKLWAIVNNSGIITYGHLEWGQLEDYKRVFEVNVFGVVRVTRKFIPLIRKSKGRIVITASLGGRVASDKIPVYCMTKSAIISFADTLRREMNKFGVNVTTIEPGVFKTQIFYSAAELMQKTWDKTDESVKQVYGDEYFNKHINTLKKPRGANHNPGNNLDIVVNDMINAIVSSNPKQKYQPVNGFVLRLIVKFLSFIPQLLIDRYFYSMDNCVPAIMQK